MIPHWNSIAIAAVLFLATIIRSAFGFGEALVAVPLLALLLPIEVAAPIAVLVSITVALIAVVQDWRDVHTASAGRLVLATLLGIPLGLLLLKTVAGPIVKAVLAVTIIAFSSWFLFSKQRAGLPNDRLAWLFGFCAGVLGGAYGMNGPPLALYGSLRGWSPKRFRATLQGYFLPASLLGMTGYWMAGYWTTAVSRLFLWSAPGVLVAIFLGRAINHRMRAGPFIQFVHGGLIVIGAVLLWQAL